MHIFICGLQQQFSMCNFDCNVLIQDETEVEAFEVELVKDSQGLGITIAGYVGEKSSGMCTIFLASLWECNIWVTFEHPFYSVPPPPSTPPSTPLPH